MTSPRVCAVLLAVLIGAAGCKSSDATGPGGTTGNGKTHFRATIDGIPWASNAGVESTGVPITLPGIYVLTGTQLGGAAPYVLSISLYNIGGAAPMRSASGPAYPAATWS